MKYIVVSPLKYNKDEIYQSDQEVEIKEARIAEDLLAAGVIKKKEEQKDKK